MDETYNATPMVAIIVFVFLLITCALIIYNYQSRKKLTNKVSLDLQPCTLCQEQHEQRTGLRLNQSMITALLVTYRRQEFNNYACPQHARIIHDQYQKHNLLLGWWTLNIHVPVHTLDALTENRRNFKLYQKAFSIAQSHYPHMSTKTVDWVKYKPN